MAQKALAVLGMTVAPTDPTIIGATFVIVSQPSAKVKAEKKGVYSDGVDFTVATAVQGKCAQGAPLAGTLNTTAGPSKAHGGPVNRVEDTSDTLTIVGVDSSSGAACEFDLVAEITDAGQTKVTGE